MSSQKTPADNNRNTEANADAKATLAVTVGERRPPTLNAETLKLSKVLLTGGLDLVGKVEEVSMTVHPIPPGPFPSRLPVRGELFVLEGRVFVNLELSLEHGGARPF
jgi:hypothetical protein